MIKLYEEFDNIDKIIIEKTHLNELDIRFDLIGYDDYNKYNRLEVYKRDIYYYYKNSIIFKLSKFHRCVSISNDVIFDLMQEDIEIDDILKYIRNHFNMANAYRTDFSYSLEKYFLI
ncbi:hypothetical protein M0Q50_09370 [bacterium]|jgi:hypothetical protein|nr:hypothetical protein [bacterium]